MHEDSTRPSPRSALAALAAAAVALVVQIAFALPGAFLWDDLPLLVARDLYTSPEQWSASLVVPLGMETWYWRPLATTSFLLESLVHGGSASGFRLTAALLHAGATGCATLLLGRLLRSPAAALVAGLVWGLHPGSVEATTWISGRFDLLSALFMLLALFCVPPDGSAASRARRIALGVAAAAALLSKENAVVLPALVVLWGLVLAPVAETPLSTIVRNRRRTWMAPCVGLAAVLLVRLERLGFVFGVNPTSVEEAGGALSHVLLVGRAFGTYVEVLVCPWSGVGPAHHGPRPVPADDVQGWIGLVILVAVVAWTLLAWRRRERIAGLLTAFLVTLAPVLQIVPLDLSGGLHAADRYVYLPSFFAVAAGAEVVRRLVLRTGAWPARRGALIGAAAMIVLSLAVGRALILPNWTSPGRFWAWAVDEAPESSITLSNRVQALLGSGWIGPAERDTAYDTALALHRLEPEFGQAHLVIEVLLAEGRPAEALRVANQALQFHARDASYRILRGRARLLTGAAQAATDDFRIAADLIETAEGRLFLSLLPDALAGAAEGLVMGHSDRIEAETLSDRAETMIGRSEPSGVVQLARARLVLQDAAGTLRALGDGSRIPPFRLPELVTLAALTEMPESVLTVLGARADAAGLPAATFHAALAFGHEQGGRWAQAVAEYERTVELVPDSARAWDDLGYARFESGDVGGCEEALRRAVEVDAAFAQARLHLGVLLRKTGRPEEGLRELESGLRLARDAGEDDVRALIERQLEIAREEGVEDAPRDGR